MGYCVHALKCTLVQLLLSTKIISIEKYKENIKKTESKGIGQSFPYTQEEEADDALNKQMQEAGLGAQCKQKQEVSNLALCVLGIVFSTLFVRVHCYYWNLDR